MKISETLYNKLNKPYTYTIKTSGKQIREKIIDIIADKYDLSNKDRINIKNILFEIHNCSLIIDDVQDKSLLRRGVDCAYIKYGVGLSINSAYLKLFELISKYKYNSIISCLTDLHYGQGMDVYWSENNICPTENEYLLMISLKTTALFKLISNLINEIINVDTSDLSNYLKLFGNYFQILDDYINITDAKYWEKKGYCTDIYEKKYSYPIILAINNKITDFNKIIDIYKKKNINDSDVKTILTILNNGNILLLVENNLNDIKKKILDLEQKLNINLSILLE